MSSEEARTVAWMGPSFVPLGNINSGFRVYEVDSNVSSPQPKSRCWIY